MSYLIGCVNGIMHFAQFSKALRKMKRTLGTLVIGLFLLVGTTSAWAEDFWKGFRAFDRGDYATAVQELRPYAEKGNALAQNILGVMYNAGSGVVLDYNEAAKWYLLAAEQGHANGQFNLATMYQHGQGVLQNYVKAHMWFNISAASGNTHAPKYRDIVAERMTLADISKAQQLARECVEKNYKGC